LSETVALWVSSLNHNERIFIFGDATGNSRTANSKQTNWQIVNNAFRKHKLKTAKRYGDSNPAVLDRVLSVNNLMIGDRLFFCSEMVPELVKDLETVAWKGDAIDKSDIARSHISDAMGYLVFGAFPYKKAKVTGGAIGPIPGLPV